MEVSNQNMHQMSDNRRQMLVDNLEKELQNVNNLRIISDAWGGNNGRYSRSKVLFKFR